MRGESFWENSTALPDKDRWHQSSSPGRTSHFPNSSKERLGQCFKSRFSCRRFHSIERYLSPTYRPPYPEWLPTFIDCQPPNLLSVKILWTKSMSLSVKQQVDLYFICVFVFHSSSISGVERTVGKDTNRHLIFTLWGGGISGHTGHKQTFKANLYLRTSQSTGIHLQATGRKQTISKLCAYCFYLM